MTTNYFKVGRKFFFFDVDSVEQIVAAWVHAVSANAGRSYAHIGVWDPLKFTGTWDAATVINFDSSKRVRLEEAA